MKRKPSAHLTTLVLGISIGSLLLASLIFIITNFYTSQTAIDRELSRSFDYRNKIALLSLDELLSGTSKGVSTIAEQSSGTYLSYAGRITNLIMRLNTFSLSEEGSHIELLAVAKRNNKLEQDLSSPLVSHSGDILEQYIKHTQSEGWDLVIFQNNDAIDAALLSKRPIIEPKYGQVIAYIVFGVSLNQNASITNRLRQDAEVDGLELSIGSHVLSASFNPKHSALKAELLSKIQATGFGEENQRLSIKSFLENTLRSELDLAYKKSLSVFLIAIFLTALLSFLLIRRVTTISFDRLLNFVDMVRQGHREAVFEPGGITEFNTLGLAFQNMISSVNRSEEALRYSEEQIRMLLNSTAEAIYGLDMQGVCTFANPACLMMLGYHSTEDLIGQNMHLLIHGKRADGNIYPESECPMYHAVQSGSKTHVDDDVFWRVSGEQFPVEYWSHPIFRDEKVIGAVVTFIDITDRREAELLLRASEQQQRDLLNNTSSVIYMKDIDGRYIFVNKKYERLFHITDNEIKGKTDYDLFPKNMADAYRANDLEVYDQGALIESEEIVPHDDGNHTYISVKFPLKRTSGDTYAICGISTDITDRKLAEEENRQLRNYLSNIIDSMPSILIGVNTEGHITQWNNEAKEVLGIAAEDAVGQPLAQAFPRLSEEMERVLNAIRTRKEACHPKRSYQIDGETHFEDITIYPLVSNGVEGAVIRVDDVTEQVRVEEMMIQSEKMLSVGGLAAGMAHEINNPLAGMLQTADVMKNRLTKTDMPANLQAAEEVGIDIDHISQYMEKRAITRMVNSIIDSGQRVAEIVDNMLSFARQGGTATSSHVLSKLLDKTLELASTDYDLKKQYDFKSIKIIKEYADNLPPIPCEGAKIQQVLLNLLRNAAQAMQDTEERSPTLTLRTAIEPAINMIRLEIEDNGPGMDVTTKKRIFEPFFTTKPLGEGTGLGLSVSYFIVTENHKGKMSVESGLGKGTRFIIRLPLSNNGVSN